jgi:hypothetical protein
MGGRVAKSAAHRQPSTAITQCRKSVRVKGERPGNPPVPEIDRYNDTTDAQAWFEEPLTPTQQLPVGGDRRDPARAPLVGGRTKSPGG